MTTLSQAGWAVVPRRNVGIPTPRIGLYGAILLAGLLAPVRVGVVRGESMAPTYRSGQVYAFNPFRRDPVRGQVVVFRRGAASLIKRVIAAGGDTVYVMRWGQDNAVEVVSREVLEHTRRHGPLFRGAVVERMVVPHGSLFVVGDNLGGSEDSRTFGMVPTRDVLGTVLSSPAPRADWLQLAVRHTPTALRVE